MIKKQENGEPTRLYQKRLKERPQESVAQKRENHIFDRFRSSNASIADTGAPYTSLWYQPQASLHAIYVWVATGAYALEENRAPARADVEADGNITSSVASGCWG
jgi:hypothetical protein